MERELIAARTISVTPPVSRVLVDWTITLNRLTSDLENDDDDDDYEDDDDGEDQF